MNPILKNILAVVLGIVVGSVVNMGLITIGSSLIAPPAGVDPQDVESIKANIDAYEFKHFIIPLLAHILGAFCGALVTAKISNNLILSLLIGAVFMAGGIMMMTMIPQPTWFTIVDLVLYLPAAYLGFLLGRSNRPDFDTYVAKDGLV